MLPPRPGRKPRIEGLRQCVYSIDLWNLEYATALLTLVLMVLLHFPLESAIWMDGQRVI